MAKREAATGLDCAQDLPYQRREWFVERVGWALMLLLVLAALLGLLGSGPLSQAVASATDASMQVEYPRFDRYQSPTELRVHLQPTPGMDTGRLWLDREFIDRVQLARIDPEPLATAVAPDRFVYSFGLLPADAPVTITFHLEPNRFGRMPVRLGLVDGPELAFTVFVLP